MNIARERKSLETDLKVEIAAIKGTQSLIDVGVPFFEHMLRALCFYAGIEVTLKGTGDLEIDTHHTLEDSGILMGQALLGYYQAIGNFKRFASAYVPMDESLVRTALDISGRAYFTIEGMDVTKLSGLEQSLLEFLRSLTLNAKITVHVDVIRGTNRHHLFEAIFKSYGKALGEALSTETYLMSTKGCI